MNNDQKTINLEGPKAHNRFKQTCQSAAISISMAVFVSLLATWNMAYADGSCVPPVGQNNPASSITQISAVLNADILSGQDQVSNIQFAWGTNPNNLDHTVTGQIVNNGNSVQATLNSLQPGTVYYYRLLMQSPCGVTSVCCSLSFKTLDAPNPPTCSPNQSSVPVNSPVVFTGSLGSGSYTWSAPDGSPATGSGSTFSVSYASTGLKTVTINSGSQSGTCTVTIVPNSCQVPGATTQPAINIATTSATIQGSVSNATSYIFQYGLSATNLNQTISAQGSVGSLTASLTGLQPNTVYFYQITATNSCGNTSGSVLSFRTLPATAALSCAATPSTVYVNQSVTFIGGGGLGTYAWTANGGSPSTGSGAAFVTAYASQGVQTVTVTDGSQTANCSVTVQPSGCSVPSAVTLAASSVSTSTAILNGTASNYTGTVVFLYGTDQNNLNQSVNASSSGSTFSASLTGLQANTTYYFQIKAQNSCGPTYGGILSFLTASITYGSPSCSVSPASVTTGQNVTVSATGGDGNYSWAIPGGSPTSGTGSSLQTQFSSTGTQTITVTSANRTGTCTVVVNPPACSVPQVTTQPATSVTQNSAILQGILSNSATSYSFSYGTNINSLNQSINAILSGTNLTANLTGLQPNTTYYFRAVATNSCGVTTAAIQSFTTGQSASTPSCYAVPQTVNVNDVVTLYASGGDGSGYTWSTGTGIPTSGTGQNFVTRFTVPGTQLVTVYSGGLSGQCGVTVNQFYYPPYYPPVYPPQQPIQPNLPQPNGNRFQITKAVRNVSDSQVGFGSSVQATPLQVVEFEIRVRNTDTQPESITIRDAMPTGLIYQPGSAQSNGSPISDSVIYSDTPIGILQSNQEAVIHLRATVAGNAGGFLNNQVTGTLGSNMQNAFASVSVGQVLGAAEVVTGPEDTLPMALLLGLSLAAAAYFLMMRKENPLALEPAAIPRNLSRGQFDAMLSKIQQAEENKS